MIRYRAMKPLISIILPIFNSAAFIPHALETLGRQGLGPDECEIIAVDDGSTDESASILAQADSGTVRLTVISQENRGAGAARNAGLDAAHGEYVYFFDVDDDLEDGSLRTLVDQCRRDRLDVLFFSGKVAYETEEIERRCPQSQSYFERRQTPGVRSGAQMFVDQQNDSNFCGQPCLLVTRRQFAEERNVRFAEGIINEDNLFVLRATLRAERADVDPRAFYTYNVRENSVTTTNTSGAKRFVAHLVLAQEFELERIAALRSGQEDVANAIDGLIRWYIDIVTECRPNSLDDLASDVLSRQPSAALSARLALQIGTLSEELDQLRTEADSLREELVSLREERDRMLDSTTWKVGSALTAIPRAIKDR